MTTARTSIIIEALCEECGAIRKDGSAFCTSMGAAVSLAKRHHEATGHSAFARLTQETYYG